MNLKTKQTLAVLCSIGGAIGTVGTALLARKAAMKEINISKIHLPSKNITPFKDLNIKEKTVIIGKLYLPAIIVGTITIGSIVGSSVLSHKAQASIMSMAVIADQGWRKYKNQVKSTLGLPKHNDILTELSKKMNNKNSIVQSGDGLELYYEESIGYFQAKPEDVMLAYSEMNEYMNTDKESMDDIYYDGVTLKLFLDLANGNKISSVSDDILDSWGWTKEYLNDINGNCWIHMSISNEVTEDGVMPYKIISWVEEPIFLLETTLDNIVIKDTKTDFEKNRIKIEDIKEFKKKVNNE